MKRQAKLAPVGADEAAVRKRFAELIKLTFKNNAEARHGEALGALLAEHEGLELWRTVQGPDEFATSYLLLKTAPTQAQSVCWAQRIGQMRQEMAYPAAPLVERLLIDHILLCWLHLNIFEVQHTIHYTKGGLTPAQGEFWGRRITQAQRRFTRAVEALARTRTLLRAAELVNERREALRGRTLPALRAVPAARTA